MLVVIYQAARVGAWTGKTTDIPLTYHSVDGIALDSRNSSHAVKGLASALDGFGIVPLKYSKSPQLVNMCGIMHGT